MITTLMAATLAFVCNHPETVEDYKAEMRSGQELGTGKALTTVFTINAIKADECLSMPLATKVELVDDAGGAPDRIVKVRWFNKGQYIKDEGGNVVGVGVEREMYGIASQFGTKVDLGVKIPKVPERFIYKRNTPHRNIYMSAQDFCRLRLKNAKGEAERQRILNGPEMCGSLLEVEDGR